jgi:D-arabinose 1-dehydrogenase-like Zn-dependent alcohol dehydrogenase
MLAAVLKDFNQFALEDVPKLELGPSAVLVRIKSFGICATDS